MKAVAKRLFWGVWWVACFYQNNQRLNPNQVQFTAAADLPLLLMLMLLLLLLLSSWLVGWLVTTIVPLNRMLVFSLSKAYLLKCENKKSGNHFVHSNTYNVVGSCTRTGLSAQNYPISAHKFVQTGDEHKPWRETLRREESVPALEWGQNSRWNRLSFRKA